MTDKEIDLMEQAARAAEWEVPLRLIAEARRLRERNRTLIKYVSHMGCARNALGGGRDNCTCGLDEALR